MEIVINYWAVLVSTIAAMVIGTVWYGPLFGKPWSAMTGISGEQMAAVKARGMGKSYALMIVTAFIMSYVTAHLLIFASDYTQTFGVSAGLMVGLWLWLGFIVPVSMGPVTWEGKPWKLWFINSGYYLVTLLVIGVILAVWK